MNFFKYFFITSCIFLTISSCKKSNVLPAKPIDVYLAGVTFAGNGNTVATYWKNEEQVKLNDSSSSSVANAIAVQGSDIYIVGYTTSSKNFKTATIWRNGVASFLTNGESDSQAKAIAILGNDVYVIGSYTNSTGRVLGAYWKNEILSIIPFNFYQLTCAFAYGNDLYIGGSSLQDGLYLPSYFKNGNLIQYPPVSAISNGSGLITGMAVDNNDVYSTGVDIAAEVWKNGVSTPLPQGQAAYPFGIATKDSHVYVVGFVDKAAATGNFIPTYWDNNVTISLTDDKINGSANAIAINGSDIYIAGSIDSGSPDFKNRTAIYWKNKSIVQVGKNAEAFSIVLVQK